MKEDYAAKMALKTDAALREYVTGHYQYREEAVLAAFDELRSRGQPAPEEADLRPKLETEAAARQVKEAQLATEAATIPEVDPATGEAAPTGPALYSPITILLFSMLPMSTMITGGLLMGMNLYRLGKRKAMLGLALFVVVYLFVASALLSQAMMQGNLNPILGTLLFNLPAALAYVFWFWPRYVGPATSYRSRSVLMPILVCLLIVWGVQKITPYLIKRQPPEVRQQLERYLRPR